MSHDAPTAWEFTIEHMRPRPPDSYWCTAMASDAPCPLPKDDAAPDGLCWIHRVHARQCAHAVLMAGGIR